MLSKIVKHLSNYEMEIAPKVWDGSLSHDEHFIHELVTEFRQLVNGINIPDKDGCIEREFFLSNYMKYYEQLPIEPYEIIPVGDRKAIIKYKIFI